MKLTVYMEPVAKGRARAYRMKNGAVGSYTPNKTAHAEHLIREAFLDTGHAIFPAKVPLWIDITAFRSRPTSLPKRLVFPVTRPDADNYAKLVLDALNKFAFCDDGQLVDVVVRKRFCFDGDRPRIEIEIAEVSAKEAFLI